ncbi:MAG: hypothetical protein JWM34_638 [Ilumatobacteraceae bacterium]|nr:hypothetical protein [Ilumatobacteraceae bacterium]
MPQRRAYSREVLSSYDDFPIHQACVPIAHPATADLNHYDRYFFNGYAADGSVYFGLAMGLYPNRHVVDAAFSVVRDGAQVSAFASGRAPRDRIDATTVGPIRVEVVQPMKVHRLHIQAPAQGIAAELTFTANSDAIEEPHYFQRVGVRVLFDYTRLTQFGSWSGWIDLDGERIVIDGANITGTRDRSWGVRPVGEPAPSGAPVAMPQFYWLWAPVNFPDFAAHFDVNEFGDGRRWHEVGAIARHGHEVEMMRTVDYRIDWQPGTRYASAFEYDLVGWDGTVATISLVPIFNFQMSGIGYGHPEWNHGSWRGESAVGGQRLTLPVDDPLSRENVHVQTLCRATYRDTAGVTAEGTGILELLCVGDHPTGLRGILDGYQPSRSESRPMCGGPSCRRRRG